MTLDKDTIISEIISLLDEAVDCDVDAMEQLIENRVECNESLGMHPVIQVTGENSEFYVGLLGIINGICERLTGDRVAAMYDDASGSMRLIGFKKYEVKDS